MPLALEEELKKREGIFEAMSGSSHPKPRLYKISSGSSSYRSRSSDTLQENQQLLKTHTFIYIQTDHRCLPKQRITVTAYKRSSKNFTMWPFTDYILNIEKAYSIIFILIFWYLKGSVCNFCTINSIKNNCNLLVNIK